MDLPVRPRDVVAEIVAELLNVRSVEPPVFGCFGLDPLDTRDEEPDLLGKRRIGWDLRASDYSSGIEGGHRDDGSLELDARLREYLGRELHWPDD